MNRFLKAAMLVCVGIAAVAACGHKDPIADTPVDPNTPVDPSTPPSEAAGVSITFDEAVNDTLALYPTGLQATFRVVARDTLLSVAAFAMAGDAATAIGAAVTSFADDTLYERTLTSAEVNFGAITGLRVQASDKRGKSKRLTVAVRLLPDTTVVVPDPGPDPTGDLPVITFLQDEAAVYGAVNPMVRLRVTALARLKSIAFKYYPAPDDVPDNIGSVGSFGSDTLSWTGEVPALTAAHFVRDGAQVEAIATDVRGQSATGRITIRKRPAIADAALRAFPGAEGFGAEGVTGGRGGAVIHVTNLNDKGAGSLRAAVEASGTRTVVFDVSGTIYLATRLNISKGNLTIAGQTAPGDGITIAHDQVVIDADNVVVRYLRFRMGVTAEKVVESDALWCRDHQRVIVDHCSMSWSVDECGSFYEVKDFTLQWSLLAESLRNSGHVKGAHGYGGIWGGRNATFHHNMLAHHDSRNPRFASGEESSEGWGASSPVDYRNNVVYNWGGNSCYGGEATNVNFVNNYYKPGPATASGVRERLYSPGIKAEDDGSGRFVNIIGVWGKTYMAGNYMAGSSRTTSDNWAYGMQGDVKSQPVASVKAAAPFDAPAITEHTAEVAYERVCAYAGASLRRDAVDTRVVDNVRTGSYSHAGSNGSKNGLIDSQNDVGGWPLLSSLPAPKDSDGDGIPDAWEQANGLNPNLASDGKATTLSAVYTNLEMYLAALVEHITAAQNEK